MKNNLKLKWCLWRSFKEWEKFFTNNSTSTSQNETRYKSLLEIQNRNQNKTETAKLIISNSLNQHQIIIHSRPVIYSWNSGERELKNLNLTLETFNQWEMTADIETLNGLNLASSQNEEPHWKRVSKDSQTLKQLWLETVQIN